MKQLKKVIVFCLALAILCTVLGGCAKGEMEKPVATVGEHEVLYEELRYLILTQKDLMKATYGATIFDTPESAAQYLPELRDAVTEKLKANYAVLAACKEYLPNVKIDDKAVTEAVDEYINACAEQFGSEDAFLEESEKRYMTEGFIRFSTSVTIMEEMLLKELAAKGTFYSSERQGEFLDWIRQSGGTYVQHILIRNDAGEDKNANRAIAEEAREKLANGTLSMSEAVGSAYYNQDASNAAPYYVIRGVSEQSIEDVVFALSEIGEVSPVLETEEGYYVFQRMEDKEDAALLRQVESLLSSYQWAHTESIVKSYLPSVEFVWTDFGKSLDWLSVT